MQGYVKNMNERIKQTRTSSLIAITLLIFMWSAYNSYKNEDEIYRTTESALLVDTLFSNKNKQISKLSTNNSEYDKKDIQNIKNYFNRNHIEIFDDLDLSVNKDNIKKITQAIDRIGPKSISITIDSYTEYDLYLPNNSAYFSSKSGTTKFYITPSIVDDSIDSPRLILFKTNDNFLLNKLKMGQALFALHF